jgi:hypothetical protein
MWRGDRSFIMKFSLGIFATLTVLSVLDVPLFAHDPATLDAIPSAHGGQVRMMGPYHVELILDRTVAKAKKPIWIYLQNHAFQAMPSAGTTATVTFVEGGASTTSLFRPAGPESLFGIGVYSDDPALLAIVSLTDGDKQIYKETFTPFTR